MPKRVSCIDPTLSIWASAASKIPPLYLYPSHPRDPQSPYQTITIPQNPASAALSLAIILHKLPYNFIIKIFVIKTTFRKLWHCESSHIWVCAKTFWTHLTSGWDTPPVSQIHSITIPSLTSSPPPLQRFQTRALI